MVAALDLRDERLGRFGLLGDLSLGQVLLVASLADVSGDPVLLAQSADRGVPLAGLAVLLAASTAVLRRLESGFPFELGRLLALGFMVISYPNG